MPTIKHYLCLFFVIALTSCGGNANLNEAGKPLVLTENTRPVTQTEVFSAPEPQAYSPALTNSLRRKNPVKVAILLPLSGAYAKTGKALQDAAQLALFDINIPDLELLPFDTKGTSLGATRAAKEAIGQGAKLILGPLFSNEAKAVAPIGYENDINVVSFSNDESLVGQGVFLLGFAPKQQITRVTRYALDNGYYFFGGLAPNNSYGAMVIRALRDEMQKGEGYVTSAEFYSSAATQSSLNAVMRSLKNASPKTASSNPAKEANLDTEYFPTDAKSKALLIPEGGERLEKIATYLGNYNLAGSSIKLLGSGQWDESDITSNPTLTGAWFASAPPNQRKRYEDHFNDVYGYIPPRISSLAYDAVALSAALATVPGRPDFSHVALTTKRGFVGVDGIFRLNINGITERGLAVLEVTPDGLKVVDPAPTSFFD
jgi:branched-chain amino acid transport system substrate-binding protein